MSVKLPKSEKLQIIVENGAKYDQGKAQLSLLDFGFLNGIAEIREYGLKKYGEPESWKSVPDALKRYNDAMLRHLFAHLDGEKTDSESGLKHWDHFKCNVMFIDYFMRNKNIAESEKS